MEETPRQYTERILGYLSGKDPLVVLSGTPTMIARLIGDAPRSALASSPAPGKWSVNEILAHLADSEMVYGFRIRLILEGNEPTIQGTDQDLWARAGNYKNQDPDLSLEALRVTRERTVRLLRALPPKSWELFGTHSERGKETIKRVVEMLAGHDLNHLRQIEDRLRG